MNATPYVELPDAAKLLGVTIKRIETLIEHGTLKAIMLNGVVAVSKKDLPLPREKRPEFLKYKHLAGVAISMRDAARKYGIHNTNISRWARSGIVKIIGTDPDDARKVLIDEQYMAYAAEVHKRIGGFGKRSFNKDGTPFTSKN